MKHIIAIVWPNERQKAERMYLAFVLDVIEKFVGPVFKARCNPLTVAREYVDGKISRSDYKNAKSIFGDFSVETVDSARKGMELFSDRLSRCVLLANDFQDFGESLAWFIEILEEFNANAASEAWLLCQNTFSFRE
jgi:hypothetical protein